jgi:hypothetical protein
MGVALGLRSRPIPEVISVLFLRVLARRLFLGDLLLAERRDPGRAHDRGDQGNQGYASHIETLAALEGKTEST